MMAGKFPVPFCHLISVNLKRFNTDILISNDPEGSDIFQNSKITFKKIVNIDKKVLEIYNLDL